MIRKLESVSGLIAARRIALGMTRGELRAILGTPDELDGASRKYNWPCIYMYGEIQFVFPRASSGRECQTQGLLYAYVADAVDGVEGPLFLLR
jgi:hypothetical protein